MKQRMRPMTMLTMAHLMVGVISPSLMWMRLNSNSPIDSPPKGMDRDQQETSTKRKLEQERGERIDGCSVCVYVLYSNVRMYGPSSSSESFFPVWIVKKILLLVSYFESNNWTQTGLDQRGERFTAN